MTESNNQSLLMEDFLSRAQGRRAPFRSTGLILFEDPRIQRITDVKWKLSSVDLQHFVEECPFCL